MDRLKELVKPVNMVLKAKKTVSNSRQEVEKHKNVRKNELGNFLKNGPCTTLSLYKSKKEKESMIEL